MKGRKGNKNGKRKSLFFVFFSKKYFSEPVMPTPKPKDVDIEKLYKAMPDEMQTDGVHKLLVENKQDQRFLQNTLYRARNQELTADELIEEQGLQV